MSDQQHPATPPPELVQQWVHDANLSGASYSDLPDYWEYEQHIAHRAAQWGADQELEACCELIDNWGLDASDLRSVRRFKRLTLNSIALQMLATIERDKRYLPEITDTIRKALETASQ